MAAARARAAIAVALAAAVSGAGCGEQEDSPAQAKPDGKSSATAGKSRAKPVGEPSAGSVVQFADCDDWRKGTAAERRATIEVLREQLTPQTSETAASPLPDERAYEVLDRACRFETAESLRLYKLYVRAQGFAPLNE